MQKMDLDALKPRLREYLMHIRPEWNGNPKTSFRCINPAHKDQHASCRFRDRTDTFKCYSCGAKGDTLDAFQLYEEIKDKAEAIQKASTFFGVPLIGADNESTTKETPKWTSSFQGQKPSKEPEQVKPWVERLIREAREQIGSCDYLAKRGLTIDTAKRFGLGFMPDCWYLTDTFEDKPKTYPALVIPSDVEGCFVLRRLDPEAKGGRYRKHGATQVFNRKELEDQTDKRPIFIVEGEIDAMTIVQSGGRAVAMSSASNADQLLDLIPQGFQGCFVIATDTDNAGLDAGERLAEGLQAKGIQYMQNRFFPFMDKDANDNYLADPKRFAELLDEATKATQEPMNTPTDNTEGIDMMEPDYIAKSFEQDQEQYQSTLDYMPTFEGMVRDGKFAECTPTGFDSLDTTLGGGLFEGLTIIGAPTSVGKTSLTQQIADNVAKRGKQVLFVCIEMSRNEMISRSLARLTFSHAYADNMQEGMEPQEAMQKAIRNSLSERDITLGMKYVGNGGFRPINEAEKTLLHRAIVTYKNKIAGNIYFLEGEFNFGVDKVVQAVEKHNRITGKTPLVVVDYLQILAGEKSFTDKQNADKAIRTLKQLSRKYHTPVIAISAFNRESYKRSNSKEGADMTAFKDSGGIEYGCDTLLSLNEVEELEDKTRSMNLDILKNRHGERNVRIGLKHVPSAYCFQDTGIVPRTRKNQEN